MSVRTCRNCGTKIPEGEKNCPNCGTRAAGVPLLPVAAGSAALLIVLVLVLIFSVLQGRRPGTRRVGTVTNEGGAAVETESGSSDPSGSGGQNGGNVTAPSGSGGQNGGSGAEAGSRQKLYHVGDILQSDELKIVYMACGEYIETSEYRQPEPGNKYIFLRFSFENQSSRRDCSISFFSFLCYADGYPAKAYYGGDNGLAAAVSAGRLTTGCVFFEVPKSAKDIDVEYQTDFISPEKVRFAYDGEKDSGYVPPVLTNRDPGAFSVGDIVEAGRQRITFLSCDKDIPDNEYTVPPEGCSFCTLFFDIENLNTDDRDLHIGSGTFHCYADGISCPETLYRDDYFSETIHAGRKAKGTVTFVVPDSAQVVEAEYTVDYETDDHITFTVR